MAFIVAALAVLTVALSPNARAEVNGRTEHFADREVLHMTNYDPFPVDVRFNLTYDYKCGDPYYTWQHWVALNQGASINASSENNVVYYFPPCASATEVKNVVFQWLSSVRTDTPPKKDAPKPVKPQPGNPQPGNPQPGNPQPGNPQPGNPQPGNPDPGNPQPQPAPASPCSNGPLGAWSERHTTAVGRVVTVTLSNGVLSVRNEKGTWNETYQIPLSQIDTSLAGLMRLPPDKGVWQITIDAKDDAQIVTWIDSKGKRHPNYTAGFTIAFNDSETQEWAATEITNLVSQCGGGSAFNDILGPSKKKLSPDALAIELDPSANKSPAETSEHHPASSARGGGVVRSI